MNVNLKEQSEEYLKRLEKLREEINKGWDGPISKRTVSQIIADAMKKPQK